MFQHKRAVPSRKQIWVVATFTASFLYLLFYYKNNNRHVHHRQKEHKKQFYNLTINSEEMYEDILKDPNYLDHDENNFLISTPGCSIPNYGLKIKYANATGQAKPCGKRAVFITKISNEKVVFFINTNELKKRIKKEVSPKKYRCCYMFVNRSKRKGFEDTSISYTYCNHFTNGSIIYLQSEVIKVYCFIEVLTKIYEDSYMIVKKVSQKEQDIKIKATKWNVIMLGMDSMSRARLFAKMPRLGAFLRTNNWLDYRGYNTVGRNTYPNIISLLTGMKLSTMDQSCRPDIFACNKYFLWSRFREAGYVTAYGEDYLSLSDTFHPWNGFSSLPTDHYMRPLFLTGEQKHGTLICTNRLSSGKHILNYAQDFADTYRNHSYFGFFWTNSFSHNPENQPRLFEDDILELLRTLTRYENTFVVLLGDHGLQFGPDRLQVESYYDYRLPMLFIWTPKNFIKLHTEESNNLIFNQRRLISPYDMHLTLLKLSNMSVNNWKKSSEGCPTSQHLLKEVSLHRTCDAAGIGELYCSCNQLAATNIQESDTQQSLKSVLKYVAEKSKTVATSKCSKCVPLVLRKVLRAHYFINSNNLRKYYVLAWEMQPRGVQYEATIRKDLDKFTIVTDISGNNIVPLTSYDAWILYKGLRQNVVCLPNDL